MPEKGLAIIVGASQGIGECVAKGLAADGYQTVLIARDGEKLQRLAMGMNAAVSQPPLIYPLDIGDHDATSRVMDDILGLKIPVDIVVNCAAAYIKGSLTEDLETVQEILSVNFLAHYNILQSLVPVLKTQEHGYVFTIASRAGIHGFPNVGIYGASKAALVVLSESLYRELVSFNVKVTNLCPGMVNTRMARETGTALSEDEMIQPADILQAIRFILSLSKNTCIRELVLESPKTIL